MARIEQRPRDDPDGVREVDDPGAVGRELARAVCDGQHHGNRAQRLGQASGAGRLLADAAARERHRLVGEPRLLTADADLDEHEVGPVERAVEIVRQRQSAREPAALEHPSREPADDFQPLRVDVLQGELRHVEPSALTREPGHELRRVGRAAADDRDLHPFTPVRVTPSTKARCARKKTMITGAMKSRVAAIVRFHCTW